MNAPHIPPLPWGALAKWRAEIGSTPPARWDYTDPVYRLACIEAGAIEEDRAGLAAHVRLSREKYEHVLAEARATTQEAT